MNHNSKCYYSGIIKFKNTVVMVEPRRILYVFITLKNAYDVLGDNWNYIFFCGKSVYEEWKLIAPPYVTLIPLSTDNLTANEYNSLFKQKWFWELLSGEFILTIQLDSWLLNEYPYTIDYFLKQDKSFIGGNMPYSWNEFKNQNIDLPFNNLNGGLSLRKRDDMIKVIDYFTKLNDETINNYAEDVYLSLGCYMLKMKIGDDKITNNFAVHHVYYEKSFGLHNIQFVKMQYKVWNRYPTLINTNPYIFFNHQGVLNYKREVGDNNENIDISPIYIWQPYVGNVLIQNLLR